MTDAAIAALSALAGLLPWRPYQQLANGYLRLLRIRPAKPLVRAVCGLLEAFHFELPSADDDAAAPGQAPGGQPGQGAPGQGAAEPGQGAAAAKGAAGAALGAGASGKAAAGANKPAGGAPAAEGDAAAAHEGGEEEEEEGEAQEAAPVDGAAAARAQAVAALVYLRGRVLPLLHGLLVDTGKRGGDAEAEAVVRAPVALALVRPLGCTPPSARVHGPTDPRPLLRLEASRPPLTRPAPLCASPAPFTSRDQVRLLRLLPEAVERAELPRALQVRAGRAARRRHRPALAHDAGTAPTGRSPLLQGRPLFSHPPLPQGVTNLLRSRLQRVRDDARAVLVSMMAELGPAYVPYAAHVLRASLPDRGFTAHVVSPGGSHVAARGLRASGEQLGACRAARAGAGTEQLAVAPPWWGPEARASTPAPSPCVRAPPSRVPARPRWASRCTPCWRPWWRWGSRAQRQGPPPPLPSRAPATPRRPAVRARAARLRRPATRPMRPRATRPRPRRAAARPRRRLRLPSRRRAAAPRPWESWMTRWNCACP